MPRRSPGCFECRTRKVRCDLQRPACGGCVRRGSPCPGYRPAQSFVLHTFDGHGRRPEIVREDEDQYRAGAGAGDDDDDTVRQTAVVVPRAHSAVPPHVDPTPADRVQHLSNFVALYIPPVASLFPTSPAQMLHTLPSRAIARPVLGAAIDATSVAQLAAWTRNRALIHRSRSLYSTALGQLMRTIQSPEAVHEDETLMATYLLALYEVMLGLAGDNGFFYHEQGLVRILKKRGPDSIRSAFSMRLYDSSRYYALAVGYLMRKGTLLDQPEWMAVTADAAKTDLWVALMDIIIGTPRLLERGDDLVRAGAPASAVQQLLDDHDAVLARARAWLARFERGGAPRYRVVDMGAMVDFDPRFDATFATAFWFEAFGVPNLYLSYWMGMLVVRSNWVQLARGAGLAAGSALAAAAAEAEQYADNICRAIPFGYQPAAGVNGRFVSLTPVLVARVYYTAARREAKAAWCAQAYLAARVPSHYSPPISLSPFETAVHGKVM